MTAKQFCVNDDLVFFRERRKYILMAEDRICVRCLTIVIRRRNTNNMLRKIF